MQHHEDMKELPKVMLIGGVGSGKSSLAARLIDSGEEVRKTQTLTYNSCTIDTPGEYLENPFMYKNIIAVAEEADYVLFIQDMNQIRCVYPPGLARSFNKRTVGVVTKSDGDPENLPDVLRHFREIGLEEPYFITSARTGEGISELKTFLFNQEPESER